MLEVPVGDRADGAPFYGYDEGSASQIFGSPAPFGVRGQVVMSGLRMLSVRVPDSTIAKLDALAAEQGVARTRVIRQLLDAGLGDRPGPPAAALSETELVALLTERARAGNVAAIRSLLVREEAKDPQARAMALFAALAEERRS